MKMKFESKCSKIYSLSMKNLGWPLTKYWFTDVNQFQKLKNITDKKVFLSKFHDLLMEVDKIENQINFELTFSIFFHHNSKKTSHLVRPNNFQSDNIFKSPLFIKSKGWLWKFLVFIILKSKGYPFTKNPLFLIILIKIHQYPWNFIPEKSINFNETFWKMWKIYSKFFMDFSFPFFIIFLEKITKKKNQRKINSKFSFQFSFGIFL